MNNVKQVDFGDGEGSEGTDVSNVSISPLDVGYLLVAEIGEEQIREAYMDRESLINRLLELL